MLHLAYTCSISNIFGKKVIFMKLRLDFESLILSGLGSIKIIFDDFVSISEHLFNTLSNMSNNEKYLYTGIRLIVYFQN